MSAMSNPFAHIWLFTILVLSHIVTLAAGCVVTVLIGIIEKHVFKRPVSLKVEIGVFLLFLFFACFQTWRDEYEKAKISIPPAPVIQITVPPAQGSKNAGLAGGMGQRENSDQEYGYI
jgi:hypothetical protein